VNSTPRGNAERPSKALPVAQAEASLRPPRHSTRGLPGPVADDGIRTEKARTPTWEQGHLDGRPDRQTVRSAAHGGVALMRARGDIKSEQSKRSLALPDFVADASESTGPGRPSKGCEQDQVKGARSGLRQ
jgi:hypothetical protein